MAARSNPRRFQDDFNGFPLTIGSIFGERAFDVSPTGELEAVYAPYTWTPGENVAECTSQYLHGNDPLPHEICMCGFWSYHRNDIEHRYSDKVRGIVEAYGRTIVGTEGMRSEKAKIVALVLPDAMKPAKRPRAQGRMMWEPLYRFMYQSKGHDALFGKGLVSWSAGLLLLTVATFALAMPVVAVPLFMLAAYGIYGGIVGATLDIKRSVKTGSSRYSRLTKEMQRKIAAKYPDAEIYASVEDMEKAYTERMDILKGAPEFKKNSRQYGTV